MSTFRQNNFRSRSEIVVWLKPNAPYEKDVRSVRLLTQTVCQLRAILQKRFAMECRFAHELPVRDP